MLFKRGAQLSVWAGRSSSRTFAPATTLRQAPKSAATSTLPHVEQHDPAQVGALEAMQLLGAAEAQANDDILNLEPLDRSPGVAHDWTSAKTYAATTQPPAQAYTLSPETYTSEDFFKLERERVFGKSWVCIGLADDVRKPGDTIVAELGGKPMFAVRDKKGELNGFLNVCRHRGSKLVRKSGRYPVISCPYHRWGYALDGRLLATPLWDTVEGGERFDAKTGEMKAKKEKKGGRSKAAKRQELTAEEAAQQVAAAEAHAEAAQAAAEAASQARATTEGPSADDSTASPAGSPCSQMKGIMEAYDTAHIKAFDRKDFSLFNVRVEQWGCLIFATLASEEEVPPLHSCLGDVVTQLESYPLDELVSVRSKKYESKANWKLLAENFMEYYHLPSVHPALCEVSRVDDHHREQGASQAVSFVTKPLTNGGTPIDPDVLPPFPKMDDEHKLTGVFHHLFPNVFYFLLPHHIFVVRLDPQSPELTTEHADLLVHPSVIEDAEVREETDLLNRKIDAMFDFYDMTNIEDLTACQWVQEGVAATEYKGGRVSFRFEETIHRFQNMLVDHMVGYPGRVPLGDSHIPFYIGGQPPLQAKGQLVDNENAADHSWLDEAAPTPQNPTPTSA